MGREPALIIIEGFLVLEVSDTQELYRLLASVLRTVRCGRWRIDTLAGPELDPRQRTFCIKGHHIKSALQYVEEFAKRMHVQRNFLPRWQQHFVDRKLEACF